MILQKVDSESYRESFISKFTNFADKAPIIISFATDDIGVSVVHENSGKKYFYPWDYVVPVKSFIHDIKRDLTNHYPRISRVTSVERTITDDEYAEYMSNGTPIDEIPTHVIEETEEVYRIDKILVMKDELILINEETLEQFCYRMNTSAFSFLRNYRSGEFNDIAEAGEYFFKRADLVSKLNKLAE